MASLLEKTGMPLSEGKVDHASDVTDLSSVESRSVEDVKPLLASNSDIPDGGLVAWLQVFGSFLIFANAWGIVNTFGVFQTFYDADLLRSNSSSAVSWVGSIQGFLLLVLSLITGPIFDMGHLRGLLCAGTFLLTFGLFMTSISTQYYQVLLAQGVCVGLGGGCLFIPSVAVVATYFQKRRSFAMGVAATGSSIGGIIYPSVFRQLEPKIGFPWATRVIAFIALGTLAIPIVVMKQRTKPSSKRKIFDLSAWKEAPYVLFVAGGFIGFVGLFVPFFFTSIFAMGKTGATQQLAFYLIPILNAASTFGRLIPGFVADRFGPLNVLIPCTFAAGILAFSWIAVHDVGGVIVFAILYGFFSGTFVSLPPSTIATLSPNLSIVGTRLGMAFCVCGTGILIGSPIAGALLDTQTMNFLPAQIFCGATVVASGVLYVLARIARAGVSLKARA